MLGHGEHQPDGGALARRYELDGRLRQSGGGEAAPQAIGDRRRGMKALGAAAQDGRIAGLEAQSAGIGGHVGPRFVDDADDAERHAHALEVQPVRLRPVSQHAADRLGQGGDLFQPMRHRFDSGRIESQAVEHRSGKALPLRRIEIALIGGKYVGRRGADGSGGFAERRLLAIRGGSRELPGRGARSDAKGVHLGDKDAIERPPAGRGQGEGSIRLFRTRRRTARDARPPTLSRKR